MIAVAAVLRTAATAADGSSEDEDLSIFASCAVSADQIEKNAEADAKKRVLKASQRPIASAARTAAASRTPAQQAGDGEAAAPPGSSTGLDLISEKIATALDAILARELDDGTAAGAAAAAGTPAKCSKQQATAAHGASPIGVPAVAAAAVADAVSDDDDGTGVQLFRAVAKGTPCVIQQDSRDAWDPLSPSGQAQQQQGQHSQQGFGGGSLGQQQRLRDQIPRLCLAERSRQASKRRHESMLAALAVEGAALQAAAAAAGYPGSRRSSSGTKGGAAGSKASTTAAWVKGWKRMKGQKAQGVVVEAKQWVPYEVRAAKLLGTQPAC